MSRNGRKMAIDLILGFTLYLAKPIHFCKSPYLEPGLCAQQNYYSRKKLHALTHYAILPEERYYTYEELIADSFKSKGGLISECIIIITICSKKKTLINIELSIVQEKHSATILLISGIFSRDYTFISASKYNSAYFWTNCN